MFRTNTWIREHRGHTATPAQADEIVLDFLRQTELQAVPVSAGSRTFLFSLMGVRPRLLSSSGGHPLPGEGENVGRMKTIPSERFTNNTSPDKWGSVFT